MDFMGDFSKNNKRYIKELLWKMMTMPHFYLENKQ